MLLILLTSLLALLSVIDSTDVTDSLERHPRSKRLALHPSQWRMHLWPGGVVPYEIAPHYNEWERGVILSAMAEFPKHTCITFRPRNAGDRYYLTINKYYNLERCFSYIGRQTTYIFRTPEGNVETRMRLDPSCLTFNGRGTVMHELMHILGFYHEHQRDDRDPRVGGSATHYNYKIYPRWSTYYMGKYDPTSIMHYNFPGIVYPRSYFSVSDILRINTLYNCPKTSATSSVATSASTTTTRGSSTTGTTWAPQWPTRAMTSFSTQRSPQWVDRTTTSWVPRWPSRRTGPTTTWVPRWPSRSQRIFQVSTTSAPTINETNQNQTQMPGDDEQLSRNGIVRKLRF
nr:Peptidase M12A domain containing protein [Haemonchus contortus]